MNHLRHAPVLFYCRTPLQTLIMQRVIDTWQLSDVTVLYHPAHPGRKHDYCFAQLGQPKKHRVDIHGPGFSDTLSESLSWRAVPVAIRRTRYAAIFVASITSIPLAILTARNPQAELITYDDGTLNLDPVDWRHFIHEEPFARVFAKRLLRAHGAPTVLALATRHVSIYPPEVSVCHHAPIDYISLLDAPAVPDRGLGQRASRGRRPRVLLGSWFHEPALTKWHDRLASSERFDLFLPHPATRGRARASSYVAPFLDGLNLEDAIAERVCLHLAEQGPSPIVFGFESTALCNLSRTMTAISFNVRPSPFIKPNVAAVLRVHTLECRARALESASVQP